MNMKTKRVTTYEHKSVSLGNSERKIINDLAARLNISFSGALRIIIRQYQRPKVENDSKGARKIDHILDRFLGGKNK